MTDGELLGAVRQRMRADALPQEGVAKACGLSQPHLSRVLAGKVPLAAKTRAALAVWLADSVSRGAPAEAAEMARIVRRLSGRPSRQVMQIMHLLRTLDRLIP